MSETDRLVEYARSYAEGFEKSDLAMPPSKRVAVLACMDARLIPTRVLGLGQRPEWRAQAFSDLEADVRDSIVRLRKSPFIPNKDSIRGFVYDVRTGELREVT